LNILITGASGFIGNSIFNYIKKYNFNVTCIGTKNEQLISNCQFFDYKTFDYKTFNEKIDIVFHQAANNETQLNDKKTMLYDNYYYPCKFFNHLYNNGCRKFIYASSCAVYGNATTPYSENNTNLKPLTYYGLSKKMFDDFAMNFYEDATVVGLRYSNVYGPNEGHKKNRASMIYQIINKIKNNSNVVLFKDGTQQRDWIHIDDVVKANLQCVSLDDCKEIINCGSGASVSFNDIIKIVSKHYNWTGKIEYIDNKIQKTYQDNTCCDNSKLISLLEFIPENVEIGIDKTIKAMSL
jgi:ADP-L-glycero-D-manno-heptose 6-epimerase